MTPGPTPAPPEVLAAMAQPVIHHRGPDYRKLYSEALVRLREVFRRNGQPLAGDEKAHPPSMYADIVAGLAGSGLHVTTHYGEAGGAEFPREAVEALNSERLGHGVSVAEDPSVVALVRERDVTLEMCPTSNRRTGAVPSLEEHPARRLLDQEVSVTINTDNPGLFAVDLTNELRVCVERLGFSDDDVRRVTSNALDASFVGEEAKADVRRRHFGWVDR